MIFLYTYENYEIKNDKLIIYFHILDPPSEQVKFT